VPLIFTLAAKLSGLNITGVDIAPDRFRSAIANLCLQVERCDIETEMLPFDDNYADLVVFNEIFEHLRIDPTFTIGEVIRVLRPGGRLLLSTPNLRSLDGIMNFMLRGQAYSCSGNIYAEYRKLHSLGHMGHVREYTFPEVAAFLANAGLEVESVSWRGSYKKAWKRTVSRIAPSLRPFMTIAARKKGD
jgi:SAM-dependent methyltransferase